MQLLLEQPHAVHVLAQAPARFGGPAGLITHDQCAAHALLQQPNALGHRRGRHMKCEGCALEAALSNDGCQGGQRRVVQH
jgi:hypothetical protein